MTRAWLTVAIAATVCWPSAIESQDAPLPQFDAQTVARNLEIVWAMAFAPDGRLFVTERPGRIRVITRDVLAAEPWAVLQVHESVPQNIESGLMGIAIDPRFSKTGRVYVCYTNTGGKSNRIAVLTEAKPQTGRLFATEHGTGPGGNNEVNVIERGKNYGWPTVIGITRDARFVDPILVRSDAPAGATFVTGDRYPALRGNLLIAT